MQMRFRLRRAWAALRITVARDLGTVTFFSSESVSEQGVIFPGGVTCCNADA